SSGCLRAWERGTSTRVWVAGLATLPVTYCFSLCSWCDRMACSGVGSPSGSEASMLSLVGSDRRLSNKCPSERKCHHARLPLECASESRQSTRPARYETKTRDISAQHLWPVIDHGRGGFRDPVDCRAE